MISDTRRAQSRFRRRSAGQGLAVLGSLALAAGLTGCGGGGGTVKVGLQEWAVVPEVASVEHGKVTFAATNTGPDDPHELVVFKTDLGIRDLPKDADGKVDEKGAGLTFIGEIEEFEPGKTASATFDLSAGRYVLMCNIVQDEPDGTKESHYVMGMSTAFTVK